MEGERGWVGRREEEEDDDDGREEGEEEEREEIDCKDVIPFRVIIFRIALSSEAPHNLIRPMKNMSALLWNQPEEVAYSWSIVYPVRRTLCLNNS